MKNRISMKKNWKARLVSGLLSLAMVASLLPAGLFTLPAQAAEITGGTLGALMKDNPTTTITFTNTGGSAGVSIGNYCVVLMPDLSNQAEGVPSNNIASLLANMNNPTALRNRLTSYGIPWDTVGTTLDSGTQAMTYGAGGSITFNNMRISKTFDAAKAALVGMYKADGTQFTASDTVIPMIALIYTGPGVRAYATADWSTVANAELVPTTTPLKAVLVDGECTIDDVIRNVGQGDSKITHIDVTMDGDSIEAWFDTYSYTLNDIAAGGSDTGTLSLALNGAMADNFLSGTLTITVVYNGGSKSPLQIPVLVVKDAGVTATPELIFNGKVTYDADGNFTGLTFTDTSKNVTLTPGESGNYVLGDTVAGADVFIIDNDLGWDASSIQSFFDEGDATEGMGYFDVGDVQDFAIAPPGSGSDLESSLTSNKIAVTTDFVSTLKIRVASGDMWDPSNATELMVRLVARITPEYAAPAEEYNYTFKANLPSGSSGSVSGLPAGGQTTGAVSYPTAPTLTGYTFKGWGTTAAGASAPTTADWTSGSKTISADTDFHAIWEPYKITFNPNSGKFGDNSTTNKDFNTVDGKLSAANVSAVATPTRTGYAFDGWYTAATGGTKLTDLSATKVFSGSATYYAHWTAYTVTFDPNGGSLATASGTGVFNTTNGKLTSTDIGKVTGSNAPTHTNVKKAFRGWSTTTSADDIVTLSADTVYSKNTTYHAIWGDLYTITYNDGGADSGSVPAAQTQTSYGQELTVAGNSGNLAKAGYIFGGWSYNGGTYGPGKTEKLAPTEDVTLTAIWLKTYSLIYNSNTPSGGTVENMPDDDDNSGVGYLPGETTTVTSDKPTCAGYTFLGWATSADATSAAYTGGESQKFDSANINLYAVWSELPAISGATATDASKFEFGGSVSLKDITLTAGGPLAASDVGSGKKVPVAKWYVGNGGNSTTGPSRKTELAAGPASGCTIPAASAGTVFENDDIWVYLEGNGTDVKTDGKWVKLGTIGAKSAALTITPIYVSTTGTVSTTTSLTPKPTTVGGGSYKAGVDVNISTSYNGEDLTFFGWSTKNDGTLSNVIGSTTLIKSPAVNPTNGSATVNMNTNSDGDPVATTIYAVYKVKPTLSFTVAKASGADIDSVKVTRSRGNVDITLSTGGGFGAYNDKVQVGDTVIVASTAGADSDPDGFTISGTAGTDYTLVTSSKSSVVVKLLKTGVTITAKSKAKPPRLNLEPSAGAGTLDGTTFTHNTAATVAVGNLGGSNAVSVSASIPTTGDAAKFKITTPALDGTIAPEGDSTLTIVPKDGVSLAVGTYSIPVTVDYQDADGKDYTATTSVNYVVSAATTYVGQVIVKVDGTAVSAGAATVALNTLNTTAVATAAGGKVVYDGATANTKKLNKGTAYTVSVVYGGKTYVANDKLSDSSAQVDGVPTVTVDLYTVKLIAPNLSANQNALTAATASQYITLTIPKVDAVTGDAVATRNVTRENLGHATNGQVNKVLQKGTTITVTAGGALKSGNTFDKWTSDANGTVLVNSTASHTFTVNAATTLYAVMKKSATAVVTYQGNYSNAPNVDTGRSYPIGVPASQIVALGSGVTLNSAVPKLPGYQFVGWSTVATRTAAQWSKTTNAGYDFAPGDSIAALGSAVAGFDTGASSLTLYAVWKDATLTASNATGGTGTYGSYYGATPNFQVKLNNANNTEKLNYALGTTKLPGGLGLNANTGEVYGTPYQVVSGRAANVTITLADDYHKAANKLSATVTYTMTVGKATPKITSVAISGAAEDKLISAATYTVTVVGPRLKSDNGSNADTLNNPADDVWETYSDVITITAGNKTAGIGTSVISGTNAGGTAVTKFVTGGSTTINATFEAAASGADFDACSNNKQATVWKDTAEDATIKGSATYTPNTSYQMAVRLGSETQDSDYAASKRWDYATSDGKHAHVGYNTSTGTGTNGLVTLGTGTTADSVAAKQFSLKNTGTGALTKVAFTFGKGANSPFAIATAASLANNTLAVGSAVNFTVKVNAANAATKGTYQDTLTISSDEGNSVVIYLSFTVEEATTYQAQITTKFQTVANAYASPVVAAAAAKIGAANTNASAVVTLVPVGGGDNVVINSSTAYDATNKYYAVSLVTGKDYRITVTGTGAGATGYTIPGVTLTANNHAADVTMHEVALKQHFKSSTSHTDHTASTKTNTSGSVSGAGWYVNGQSAAISTYSGYTTGGTAYTFVEWFSGSAATDAACTADGVGGANTSFSTPITAAKSFNAHYKVQDAATVTLTYDKNTTDSVLVPPADTVTLNASGHFTISSIKPNRLGYIFEGWANNKSATTADYQPGAQGPATGADATVYAVWTEIGVFGPTEGAPWTIDPPDGTYGVDYSYAVPAAWSNAGKVTYSLSTTTDGTTTTAGGKTIITTLPGGLYLDATTGLISGKPYEVIANKGPYVLKATHELGDDVVEPLYSQPFYITVDKYQLQLTSTSVTGAVAGQGADTATYTATVVDAPIYKGKTDGVDVWGVTGANPFTETVTRTNGTSDASKLGTLALDYTSGSEPTFNASSDTTVKLVYQPSAKDASKDGNGSKHEAIYKPATATVKASSGGSTYTMKVTEERVDWANAHSGAVNEGAAITMWGPGATAHQDGFKAKEDYEHAASSSNAKWGTGETVSATGANDKVNAQKFTLTNTGNQTTGEMKYRFGSATADNTAGKYFSIANGTLNWTNGLLASGAASNGDKGDFYVIPVTGLPYQATAYTDTLVITNENGFSVTITLKFTVTADDMSLKVITYLWNKDTYKASPSAAEIAAAKMNLKAGNVVLVNTADSSKTITLAAAAGTNGEYTFTQYAANNKIAQDDAFYIKINGYTVTDTTTGLPKVLNKANDAVGVYLYEVTSAKHPTGGAAAVPALASSKSAAEGGITSTTGSIYVVHGETATVTAQAAAAGYTYKELQDTTTKTAPNGDKATSGTAYTTAAVTAPKAYTAVYTQGYKLTYAPNGANWASHTTTAATNVAEEVQSGDVTVKAPSVLTKVVGGTTYTGFAKTGSTFVGWSTEQTRTAGAWSPATNAGADFAPGDAITISGDVTLYAVWRSADELTLEGETITVAYKETIDKDFEATGGQSGKEYTAEKSGTDVPTNTNAVPDIKFIDGGNTGADAEKFSFTGVSNDAPTGTDTEKTTTVTITVTDGNDDTKSADFTIIQKKADTEITKGFEDGVIDGATAPKAGDDFDFTKLNKPTGDLEVIAKKADGTENPNVDFAEDPTNKNGSTTPGAGEEGGTWSVTQIDGVDVPEGTTPKFQEGEHKYTLTYTPTNPGFKPSTQTITIDLAKKIDKVVVSITYPVAGQTPVESGSFPADANVHATATSPTAKKTDATVASVVWPDGLDGAGKFDRSKDITVFVKVTPNTADGWKFDKDNFTAQFSNVTVDAGSTADADNVTATVISVTDTDAVLQYTWKAQDVAATNIRVQVNAPSNGGKVDNDTALPVGTPAGSFTPAVVKWVSGNVNDTPDANTVTSANYAGLTALTSSDTVTPGTYVVIVTATANKGYLFNKDTASGGLAALDGKNDYAQINNKNAKVLKIETTADGQDKVTLAVEFTVEASAVTGLHEVTQSKLDYYVKTETSDGSGDKHHDANATGNNANYDFTLSKGDFTVTASNDQGKSVTLSAGDFILFVDGATGTAGKYDSGSDTVLTDNYTFVHNVAGDPLASSLDGKDLYVVYAPGGVVQTGDTMTLKVGTLTVKPLEAKTIAAANNWSVNAAKQFQVSAANTTVSFNDGQPMANSVATVSYAARTGALATSVTAPAAAGDNRTSYYYMLDANNDGQITDADTELKANTDVSSQGGKGVYICYTDVNGHLVYTKAGVIGANFTVDIDDVNGQDPEYGDKLTGKPENPDGTPATPSDPDKPFTYQWEKEDPDHPGTWVPIPGGTSPDYVPGKDDIGDDIRVSVTDPGTGTTVSSDPKHIEKRSINFDVAAVDKRYDGDFYNDDHAYTAADFTATAVEKLWVSGTSFATAQKDGVDTPFGGLLLGDKVTIAPTGTWNTAVTSGHKAGRPTYKTKDTYAANNAAVGSAIQWPQVLNGTTQAVGETSGYVLGGTDAASYRLRPQDVLAPRGVITNGEVTHVDVSFQEWPTYNHTIPVSPMGVTDERETQSQNNNQNYTATWYKVASGKVFDPSDASTYTAVSETKFTDGATYAVVVNVKPQTGYRYELDENQNPYTRFYFHFGEYADATKVEVSDNDHAAKNGKGVWVHDGLYTMYCTLDEVKKPDIAYVNVSVPQPVAGVTPANSVSVIQLIGTDNEPIDTSKVSVGAGEPVWKYLSNAAANTWTPTANGTGLTADGKFLADTKYQVTFSLNASDYKYLYTNEGKGVSFVAGGEGPIVDANIDGTHTWNTIINDEIIESVVTTATAANGKTVYNVTITYTTVKSGKADLMDVVVDASAATKAGVEKTGPSVTDKPYALDATANAASNKWFYWSGSAWVAASNGTGLSADGKFLAGYDYRVEGKVKLTDANHYQVVTADAPGGKATKFYIAGYEVTTTDEVEHHNTTSEKALTASVSAVNGVYPADAVFTLVKTFSIPAEEIGVVSVTHNLPLVSGKTVPSSPDSWTDSAIVNITDGSDEWVSLGTADTFKNDFTTAGTAVTEGTDAFVENTYYRVTSTIVPVSGYAFKTGESQVVINGVAVTVDGAAAEVKDGKDETVAYVKAVLDGNNVKAMLVAKVESSSITPIELRNNDVVPQTNAQPTDTVFSLLKTTEDRYEVDTAKHNGGKGSWEYKKDDGSWAAATAGSGLNDDGSFKGDTTYRVTVGVKVKGDNVFAANANGTVTVKSLTYTADPVTVAADQKTADVTIEFNPTSGTIRNVAHVDVSFKEVPTYSHNALPVMGVTDQRETQAGEGTDQTYTATWYQGAPNAAFDPTAPTDAAGNALAVWEAVTGANAGSKTYAADTYTVVVTVKPKDGYRYALTADDEKDLTRFYFHFGENQTVEVNTTKGLKEKDGVYYMWYTFSVVDLPKIAYVNVSVPQPVAEVAPGALSVIQVIGTDNQPIATGNVTGTAAWEYLVDAATGTWADATTGSGLDDAGKFKAETQYRVKFTLTAGGGYEYLYTAANEGVRFVASGEGELQSANIDGTHTLNGSSTPAIINSEIIESVVTTGTAADGKSQYDVVITYTPVKSGKSALTDVVVDATPATKAGVAMDGPEVSADKQPIYDLVSTADNKWSYWNGSVWADATNGNGLSADGKFLAGYDYRVEGTVTLKDATHYTLTTSTKFYIAGYEVTTTDEVEHHNDSGEKALTPSAAATNGVYAAATTFKLVKTFSIPAEDVGVISVTHNLPLTSGKTVPQAPADWTDSAIVTIAANSDEWVKLGATDASKDDFTSAGTAVTEGADTFEENTYYRVTSTISPVSGYTFKTGSTKVVINGVAVTVDGAAAEVKNSKDETVAYVKAVLDGNNVKAMLVAKVESDAITPIELRNNDVVPKANVAPTATVFTLLKDTEDRYDVDTTKHNAGKGSWEYKNASGNWVAATAGDGLNDDGTFKGDTTYRVTVGVKVKDGTNNVFAANADGYVTVNSLTYTGSVKVSDDRTTADVTIEFNPTSGTIRNVAHVNVSFKEVPTFSHNALPVMGVTDDRETQAGEGTDQTYTATWYQGAPNAAFDPTAPTDAAGNTLAVWEAVTGANAGSKTYIADTYTVVVKVKPKTGYRYTLTGDDQDKTRYYFHFGEDQTVEVNTAASAGVVKGLQEADGVYYMWYTFNVVDLPKIAYVNVSVPQPVAEVEPSSTLNVIQVIGTDNQPIATGNVTGTPTWEYKDADGNWVAPANNAGYDANGKFLAETQYRVKFTLTAGGGYEYLYTDANKGVRFVASGEGELADANIDGTHTLNAGSTPAIVNTQIIESVVTTGTAADGKSQYDVVITYQSVKGGKADLMDVVVDASPATQAGVVKTGPSVDAGKPYDLNAAGANKWFYWDGAAWAEATNGNGLSADGKFLAGNDYRVEAQVKLTDAVHYRITDNTTKFYIAGYEVTTGKDVEHHNTTGEKTLTADKAAVSNIYPADTVFTLVKTFSIPKEKASAELVITYPEPEAAKEPLSNRENTLWTWEYRSAGIEVAETHNTAAAPKTDGTTWYVTNLTGDPAAVADFATAGLTKLSGKFDYGTYYMVEANITPDASHDFAEGDIYVTINGVRVKVDGDMDAKYDAEGKVKIGWAMAEGVRTDGKLTAIKARYIARTEAAPSSVIYKVTASVTAPSVNGSISDQVDLEEARFDNEALATPNVSKSTVTWSVSDKADGTGYTSVTTSQFEKGKYYKAEFEVWANTGYTFEDKDNGTPDGNGQMTGDFVAFRINGVRKTGVWGVNDKLTWDETEDNGIKVRSERVAGDANKYKITVWFPLNGELDTDLAVVGMTGTPVHGQTAGATFIKVKDNEPYEIKLGGGKEVKEWDHWDGTAWAPMADSDTFVAGEYYRAVMNVVLKDDQKNLYKFTNKTRGEVNEETAKTVNALPTDKPADRDSCRTSIEHSETAGEVDAVILAQEFFVAKKEIIVHVSAKVPEAGVNAYLIEDDIRIVDVDHDSERYDLVPITADGKTYQARWYEAGSNAPMDTKAFEAGKTYYLKVTAKMKDVPYIFQDVKTGYKWLDPALGNNEKADAAVLYTNDPTWQRDKNGDTVVSYVAFQYTIPAPSYVTVIPGNAKQPVYDEPLDEKGWTSENFDVVGKVTWYEGEKKIHEIDDAEPVDYTDAKEKTVYTAAITVKPKEGVYIDPDTGKLIYTFNGETCETDEYRANPNGTYTLVHTFPPTAEKPEAPSYSGGSTTEVDSPIVYYHLKDQGVTDDPTAEKVKKNNKPKNVPVVKAISGLVFKGWSEVDPSTLPEGKLPTLVDPTTFKITKDKTFYAVYERGVDHKHYVIGFPNGTFGPDAKITRAEVATIIARSCLEGFVEGANYGNPGGYTDVSHHWAFSAIAFCAKAGVFTGYEDATFRPDRYITRQELATVVARLAGIQTSKGVPFHDKDDIASWAQNGVYTAYANGWIKGYEDGTFLPERDVNRAETVKIFNGYLKRGVDTKGLEGLKEYIHSGVASNNREDGHDEYMTWPDVPKTHWAYLEVIEAANDHNYHWQDAEKQIPPEDWDEVYINEKWKYNDNLDDGADKRDENISAQKTFTVTYLVVKDGVIYDSVSETVERFSSPDPNKLPTAVPDEGYRFAGWSSTDPSTGTVTLVDPTASAVTADKWYYAVFEEDKPAALPIYTVKYVIGEHGSYDGATVERVEMFQAPSLDVYPHPVANEGYRFAGWSETDPANGDYTLMDPTANYITGDKTFYAVYEVYEAE